ncbi:SMI1/KNR4 family protein [Sphingobacterium siyangense]|uniref:SMI1/KNR4 family protein n=1 Tax=Sphingobacterium siyangense TaxID=459529 RepID=UPI002FDD3EE5
MATIDKNAAPTTQEVEEFLGQIDFTPPEGSIEFFKEFNGADISTDDSYTPLWPLTDMVQLNKDYRVEQYAAEFFIFGSDGGGAAYGIEKNTSDIYEIPFIRMSKEDAVFKHKTFSGFINSF